MANQTEKGEYGPYDLALYIARSFGRSLPVVAIVALVAVGAWYFVRELAVLQTRLIEAEQKVATARVDQAKAESAAQSAIDRARGEIMAEQARRIAELNDASVAVSKKIQELVSGQLANMTQLEGRTEAQARASAARQKEAEDAATREIIALRKQVSDLEERRSALAADIAEGSYQEVRAKLLEDLDKRYSMGAETLVELLRPKLSDTRIRGIAEKDIKDAGLSWRYRLLLHIELYRLTGDERLVQGMSNLLRDNRSAIDYNVGRLFSGRSVTWGSAAEASLTRLAMTWVLDDSAGVAARLALMDLVPYGTALQNYVRSLSFESRERGTRALGKLLLAVTQENDYCGKPHDFLREFSQDAARVFSYLVLQDATRKRSHECILSRYVTTSPFQPPSEEQVREWTSTP